MKASQQTVSKKEYLFTRPKWISAPNSVLALAFPALWDVNVAREYSVFGRQSDGFCFQPYLAAGRKVFG
ncbi:hypothetical protein EL17_18600 [Anditalea andensis]|uniref:Uncharacterized protein n=1 Tax=Anditalea andensis TaxID=1048983 RepID=A0A074KWZ5_9BACT|nr:hypothetical protein EL17_18600 [Anditalea andensis]